MGTPRSRLRPIVLLAFASLIVAGACVAGSPLASLIVGGGARASPLASSTTTSPSPAPAASFSHVETPAPSRLASVAESVVGQLTAGPTCPVETNPPDPACAPRPLAGASVIATDPRGFEVARAVSKVYGSFSLFLAPGTYALTPQPTGDHMLRPPAGKSVTITGSSASPVVVDFRYDTGIR
jgi:hypothetical protein